MGGRASKQKGARGERLCAAELSQLLNVPIRRGCQFAGRAAGGIDAPDVLFEVVSSLHVEAKNVEKLNIKNAIDQAINDAGENKLPLVWHKKNGCESLIYFRTRDLVKLSREVMRLVELTGGPAK